MTLRTKILIARALKLLIKLSAVLALIGGLVLYAWALFTQVERAGWQDSLMTVGIGIVFSPAILALGHLLWWAQRLWDQPVPPKDEGPTRF